MTSLGVVIIGRNEGERLVRCIRSVAGTAGAVVYVDSGSTDRSVEAAQNLGVKVVPLDTTLPFTAARARNAGFGFLVRSFPEVKYVQFVDGDCEVDLNWMKTAARFLETHVDVAVVCGRRRERFPEHSIYNRLCDLEWDTPIGDALACGGDAMMPVDRLQSVGGYRESLIAGEEPELCARLRAAGGEVVRLDAEMTLHDAAMTRFGQWWRRALRAGHAYAEVSRIHGRSPDRLWVRECRSNWFWGLILPLVILAIAFLEPILSALLLLGYVALLVRTHRSARRRQFSVANSRLYAGFCVLAKFPAVIGQIRYYRTLMLGQQQRLIEYKTADPDSSSLPRVAYLVNQYPHVSHSFIRREIRGLEKHGLQIQRYSIRQPGVTLVDADDQQEQKQTRVLLDAGGFAIAMATLWTLISSPLRFLHACHFAWRLGKNSGRRLRTLIYLAEACILARWLRKQRIDHVHAHFGTNPVDVAALTNIITGIPYSFTVHGPEEFDRPQSISLSEKIERADFVIAISSYGRSQLYRWCSQDMWSKIHVVHCGVDETFLNSGAAPIPSKPRMVCVGRLAEQKGQLLLVQSAAELQRKGVKFELVLAGDGPMRPLIEAAIARSGLTNDIRITGWISSEQVRDEMLAARFVVLPSFAEGLPVVLMEALALGRPVVTTYVAGIPELVHHGANGWLVPSGDVDALTAVLATALETNDDNLSRMGEAGVAAVRAAHDATKEAGKLFGILAARVQNGMV